jgi:hypothetical protein
MKVEGPSTGKIAPARRRSAVGQASADFASELVSESVASPATVSISGMAAPAAVDTILALQASAAEDGDAATARAKSRALDILRRLELLRLDLLTGAIPKDHLIGLAQSVKNMRENVMDPRLNDLLDEIDLRAQVELAKHDPFR